MSFEDGTILSFGGTKMALRRDEWLSSETVIAIFRCFLRNLAYPDDIDWRDISSTLG